VAAQLAAKIHEPAQSLDARVAVAAAAPTPIVVGLVEVLHRELHAAGVDPIAQAVRAEFGFERFAT
jgi:hypothetical protein